MSFQPINFQGRADGPMGGWGGGGGGRVGFNPPLRNQSMPDSSSLFICRPFKQTKHRGNDHSNPISLVSVVPDLVHRWRCHILANPPDNSIIH